MSFEFNFPWQYNFPPFFTIQPNLETKRIQLEAWSSLILSWCCFKKINSLNLNQDINEPIFFNKSISRQLNSESLIIILDYMRSKGLIEWENKEKTSCFVYWRTIEEWAKLIYDWAKKSGLINTVCTFYEIINSEENINQPFYELDLNLLIKVLKFLEKENKAAILQSEEYQGVKFF